MRAAREFNTYDALKLFALVVMTIDHLAFYLMPELTMARVIGRMAAPIFCFLVGYNGRYQFRWSLLIAALLVSLIDAAHHTYLPLNILWVILIGREILRRLEQRKIFYSPWVLIALTLLWLPVMLLAFEYGTVALLWMLWGREHQRNPTSTRSWVYAVASAIGILGCCALTMDLNPIFFVATIPFALLTCALLQSFRLHDIPWVKTAFFKAWSRHALAYYVIHRAVLVAIALAIARFG